MKKIRDEKISVIVPIYNAEKYLKRCIDSIVAQTYSNIEIILIDDGSKDNSFQVMEECAAKDPRIVCYRKENGGVSSARNKGLELSTGDCICFVDSDDWISNDMVCYLKSLLDDNPQCVLAACGLWRVGDYCFIQEDDMIDDVKHYSKEEAFEYIWNVPYTPTKLFRKDQLRHFFDERITVAEDSLFCFQQLMHNPNIVVGAKKMYYYYSGNTESATSQHFNIKRVNSLIGYRYMAEKAQELKLNNSIMYECGLINQCIRMLLHKAVSDDKAMYEEIKKDIRKYIIPYLITDECRLKKDVRWKYKTIAILYAAAPYFIGKNFQKVCDD